MSGHDFFNRNPHLSQARLRSLAKAHGTPLWVYDAGLIKKRIAALSAFDTVRFAQKANSNLHLLRMMRAQGVSVDAVSLGEIERALVAGFTSRDGRSELVFTADLIDEATLARVIEESIPVNAGSIDMLHQLGAAAPGHRVWLRINPGFGHGHSNKTNTGGEHSKHGIWHADLPKALAAIAEHGLQLIGLHMHIGSGVDYTHLASVCDAMVDLATSAPPGVANIEAISAGGGLSVPYQESDPRPDTGHYFQLWDAARKRLEHKFEHGIKLEIEPGRFLVAEAGLLLTEVRAVKDAGQSHFVLVDAGFCDLMRPAMYGSHHDISMLPASAGVDVKEPCRETVVGGPLCESGDMFTQGEGGIVLTRSLPDAKVGDLLVFHDTGAYGASMSSNYNSRPLIPEVLVEGEHSRLIRRRQTAHELMALELACD